MDPLDLAVLDPDPVPYWESGFRSGSRSIENDQNDQIGNSGFCLSKRLLYRRRRYVFGLIIYFAYIFHVKITFL